MLPKDMQVSALQQVDMKQDSQDEAVREEVFKEIILKVQSVINSEIARSTPTPMEGVTIGQAQAVQATQNWGSQWGWSQGGWGNSGDGFRYYMEDGRLKVEPDEDQIREYEAQINAVNNGECFKCGHKGHRAAECPTKGKGKGKSFGGKGKGQGPGGFGGWQKGNWQKGNFNMAPKGFGKASVTLRHAEHALDAAAWITCVGIVISQVDPTWLQKLELKMLELQMAHVQRRAM